MSKQAPQSTDVRAIIEAVAPAIRSNASSLLKAFEGLDRATAKFSAEQSLRMNAIVDAARVGGVPKDEKGVKAFMAELRKCQPFLDAVAVGMLEQKTVTEYAQGAGRALYHGVPWTPTLKNDKEMGLPWGKAGKGGDGAGKAGKVESTSRADLDATARKLLKQMRLLGLTGLAADTLDVLIAGLDGFTEDDPEAMV